MPFCSNCQVFCPSDYQWREHLNGRKHRAVVNSGGEIKGICFEFQKRGFCTKGSLCTYKHINAKGSTTTNTLSTLKPSVQSQSQSQSRTGSCPPGYCYLWWNNGLCSKGDLCTYKHNLPEDSNAEQFCSPTSTKTTMLMSDGFGNLITPTSMKRSNESSRMISSEFCIFKKGHAQVKNEEESPITGQKLAPIFCKPVKKDDPKPSRFHEEYRNLFQRKRDINLYIHGGLVVWEFSYNTKIIEAIKENIKGRAWNPSIGPKGCWTNPIESLPDAIELYEHMGRSVSSELKKRAEEIKSKYCGGSPSDVIQVEVEISMDKFDNVQGNINSVEDQSSIGSLSVKFLYDASIVEALRELAPPQRKYDPATKIWNVDLLALTDLLTSLDKKGYVAADGLKDLSLLVKDMNHLMFDNSHTEVVADLFSIGDDLHIKKEDNDNLVVDKSNNDNAYDHDNSSLKTKREDKFNENSQSSKNIESLYIQLDEEERARKLGEKLRAMIEIVSKGSDNQDTVNLLSSDCGSSKRSRISSTKSLYQTSSSMDACLDGLSLFATKTFKNLKQSLIPVDCDCGRPEIRSFNGVHTCRYFGTFECFCGNTWTSAYCWKGEKQACRGCENESYPTKKRPLERGLGGLGGGEHDSSRCGRCRSLGFSCKSMF